jgi:ElaB/YqjD/DUF883 family membrane-anchored ribosome-binding protein
LPGDLASFHLYFTPIKGIIMLLKNPPEESSTLVAQVSDSADQAIKSTQKAANEALASLSNAMQDLRRQATPVMAHAADSVSQFAQRGVESVRETSHQLRRKAGQASESTVNYIRDEPMKSVLIAAATGAALMALISLLSHSSRDHG